jgi:hypothetical protein
MRESLHHTYVPLIHSKKIFFQSFLRSESEVFAPLRKSALTVLDDERSFILPSAT